jgi:hypothetical protein
VAEQTRSGGRWRAGPGPRSAAACGEPCAVARRCPASVAAGSIQPSRRGPRCRRGRPRTPSAPPRQPRAPWRPASRQPERVAGFAGDELARSSQGAGGGSSPRARRAASATRWSRSPRRSRQPFEEVERGALQVLDGVRPRAARSSGARSSTSAPARRGTSSGGRSRAPAPSSASCSHVPRQLVRQLRADELGEVDRPGARHDRRDLVPPRPGRPTGRRHAGGPARAGAGRDSA